VRIGVDASIAGDLVVPQRPQALVVFAHGSGSSRFSARNRLVAERLQQGRLATLLLDLLTPQEERADQRDGHLRFDIGLLAQRLDLAVTWAEADEATGALPVGYFGASTGAAAALVAAARRPDRIGAVVSRGGRPDLAGDALAHVRAPTLLIVGGNDPAVAALNRESLDRLDAERALEVVPRATHLFEEPGALAVVADLAAAWFECHLAAPPDRSHRNW